MSTSPPVPSPPASLVRALRRVLRPLVRLMLSQGLTYPWVTELLKALFVEVADQDFRIEGRSPTDSRVSLMSGVHRKEVNRLRRELGSDTEVIPEAVSLGSQVVAQWIGSPRYRDEATGAPRPLARFASDGGELSFEALVVAVNSDIRSRVVLDEWLRLGVVHFDDQDRVRLNADAFVPVEGFDEKAFYFGHNLHDHVAAAAHNLGGAGPPFFERSVHCDGLSAASIDVLERQARKLGMAAIQSVNRAAIERTEADAPAPAAAPGQRMTFGVYFYNEPERPNEPKAPAPSADTSGAQNVREPGA